MPNVTLVANDQEQGINTLLEPDKITRNPIGDFVFYIDDDPILYIERKTGNDLLASVKDGRYQEQKDRLNQVEKHLYILGHPDPLNHRDQLLPKILVALIARDQQSLLYSNSKEDTVKWLQLIKSKIFQSPKAFITDKNNDVPLQHPSDRVIPEAALQNFLCVVPGVSTQTVASIALEYSTLKELIDCATVETIAEIK